MGYSLQQDLGSSTNDGNFFGQGASSLYLGYSFTSSSAYTLTQIGVGLIIGAGSPLTQPVTAYVYSDSGGSGPSASLGTSTNTVSSTLTASPAYYLFQFAGVALSSSTRYWIVLSVPLLDATKYPNGGGQDGGSESCYNSATGTAWILNEANLQGTMQLYVTGGATLVYEPVLGGGMLAGVLRGIF